MIALLFFVASAMAQMSPFAVDVELCDYTANPPVVVGTAQCTTGARHVGSTATYQLDQMDVAIKFSAEQEAAIANAALHWSNAAGSSIAGAFNWTLTIDPVAPYNLTSPGMWHCDGKNTVLHRLPAFFPEPDVLAQALLYADNAGDPCDIVEADIAINLDATTWDTSNLPTALTGWDEETGPFSLQQVMLHEFGHLLGFEDDNLWTNPTAVRLMDPQYPNGGDPGGDFPLASPPAFAGALRIHAAEFEGLQILKPLVGASYDNLLLWKWDRKTDEEAREVWTDPPPSSPGFFDEHWYACECECLTWDGDFPRGPHYLTAAANSLGPGMTAEARWYLFDPATHTTCSNGLLMDDAFSTTVLEGVETGPPNGTTVIGGKFQVGKDVKLCVPELASKTVDYKVCAVISPLSGGGDVSLDDSVVYSDAIFRVVDPPNCAGGPHLVCP